MNDKRNILIISIYFPPIQHIASNRIYSFAKYLNKNKYNVYVLTLADKSTSLSNEYLTTITVIRKPNITTIKKTSFNNKDGKLKHRLKALYNVAINKLGLDPYRGWTQRCMKDVKEIISKYNIDLVISSYGPLAPHRVALYIKQYYGSRIKWIADMRDELPTNKNLPYTARPWFTNISRLETAILQYADAVTSVSKPILDYFESKSKNNNCIFREIRNGFDFEIPVAKAKSNKNIFKIAYVGSFYGDRKPDLFLKLMEDTYSSLQINFQLELIGSDRNMVQVPEIIKSKVLVLDKIPHKEAIKKMIDSDLLLLIIPSNNQKGVYTGKIFEYLGSLTPIFAIVPPNDVAATLISKCNAGYIVDIDNYTEAKKIFLKAYGSWLSNKPMDHNINVIQQHHRREQTRRLELLIQELLEVT